MPRGRIMQILSRSTTLLVAASPSPGPKLGVAEAKFERADSTDKEAFKSAWLTVQEAHRAAAAAAQAAAKAYESAVEKGSKQGDATFASKFRVIHLHVVPTRFYVRV